MEHLRDIFKTRNSDKYKQNKYSLKNYTSFSEWTKSVRDLLKYSVNNLVTHLSITDKSSLKAYTQSNALNLWKWFWLQVIPWIEASAKISVTIKNKVDFLLYFPETLLKDKTFLKDIYEALENNENPDLHDILYLRNRYDLASIIVDPFREQLEENELKVFLSTMINKWEVDWFYSDKHINNKLPNWFEVPLFIWNDEQVWELNISNSIENTDFKIISRKGDLWILIWRMNPPQMGHLRFLKKALSENKQLLLFLWSANVTDEKNPFSVVERMFFLNFYFKQEIESWKLIVSNLDDNECNEIWVQTLWEKIQEFFPDFKWKLNIYGWDMKQDKAIDVLHQYQSLLDIENLNFREVERENFYINHVWEKIQVCATSVRNALSDWDYELAKKFMNHELWDIIVHKWKEKHNLLETKKLFFVYTPEFDKDWSPHRNYKKSEKIREQVEKDFNKNFIVDDISEADEIVVVWWDWSLLWAIKKYWHLWIPFYPIASWTKNFIPSDFVHPYQMLTEENEIIELPLLDVEFYDDKWNKLSTQTALNDVYLNVEAWTVWKIMVEWDKDYPCRIIEWDWLIISTPIWSTAYTKNAGWNVLPLNRWLFSVTDITSSRNISHTIADDETITIDIIKWKFISHTDSFRQDNVYKVVCKKSSKSVKIVMPKNKDFRKNRYLEN